MMWLLRMIFIGHNHKWLTIKQSTLNVVDSKDHVHASGMRYIQQCQTCGIIQKRDMV